MQTYSKNDLIRFLYHETSTTENHGIAFQLEDSGSYNRSFQDLILAKRMLNDLRLSPADDNINRILEVSRNADLLPV